MKIVKGFLNPLVQTKVKEAFGDDYAIKGDKIVQTFATYPWPKEVGHWFIRENDLYLVKHDGQELETKYERNDTNHTRR
jgi:hypothetical protein